ncbi:MAG TPA: endoribonuclease MazF [Candidatus Elarobacter sp.]|nr:endoribonuclease MazF [Candidatus Elarobacter sp.]
MSRNTPEPEDYVPDVGDIVFLNFNPQRGRGQAGRRPALVLSPREYNAKTSLAICCPITSRAKGYPFEVAIENNPDVTGVVLSDHVKSFDWRARTAARRGAVEQGVLDEVRANIAALIEL